MWWTATFEQQWVARLIPAESSTDWEVAIDLVDGDSVARDPAALIPVSRCDAEVPLQWLPYLAEERSVDEFDSSWPEARLRAVTKASMGVHQIKGTRPVMDRAMMPMQFSPTVVEWFEVNPPRLANTFRLSIRIEGDRTWTGAEGAELVRVANKAKNAHTMLQAIEVHRRTPGAVFVGGIAKRRRRLHVGQIPTITRISRTASVYVGGAVRRRRRLHVLCQTY